MQEVIVYRNPGEAAIWHALQNGEFFPVIVGIIVFFAVFLLANRFVVEKFFSWRARGTPTTVNLVVSAILGIVVVMWMLSRI